MDPEAARVEHLKMIQNVIDRMGRNSFALKAASITVVTALAAALIGSKIPSIGLGGIGVVAFWALDAYYLRQERLFRQLHDSVRSASPAGFGSEAYFSMKTISQTRGATEWALAFLKGTLPVFYGPLLLLLALSAVITELAT